MRRVTIFIVLLVATCGLAAEASASPTMVSRDRAALSSESVRFKIAQYAASASVSLTAKTDAATKKSIVAHPVIFACADDLGERSQTRIFWKRDRKGYTAKLDTGVMRWAVECSLERRSGGTITSAAMPDYYSPGV